MSYSKELKLKKWEAHFSSKINSFDNKINLEREWREWVKINNLNENIFEKFYKTVRLRQSNGGQWVVYYTETNGQIKEIRPIFRFHPEITVEELRAYAHRKTKELWNREFCGNVMLSKRFYAQSEALYYPHIKTIRMSVHKNAIITNEQVYDNLMHELVHWHLHTSGLPYDDTDFEFIEECLKWNIGLSHASDAQAAYRAYQREKGKSI